MGFVDQFTEDSLVCAELALLSPPQPGALLRQLSIDFAVLASLGEPLAPTLIVGPLVNQTLRFDGTNWVNTSFILSDSVNGVMTVAGRIVVTGGGSVPAKINIDGVDGAFISNEVSLYEAGGNLHLNMRGQLSVHAGNAGFTGNIFALGAGNPTLFTWTYTDTGAMTLAGGTASSLGIGHLPTNILDVRTGGSGVWGQYALIGTSPNTADMGGLLLTNAFTGLLGTNAMKLTATFNASASNRFRMGWVDESATETWLNGVASIEIGPKGSIGLLSVKQDSIVLNIAGTGPAGTLTGTDQRGVTIDFQAGSGATAASTALVLRTGTTPAAFTVTSAFALHIFDALLGAGSTITTQYGILVEAQTHGTTSIGIQVTQGTVATGILISQPSGVTQAGFIITGGTQTGATAASGIALIQTWNTTGGPRAILVNITNTASAATSRLIELQVASASMFSVDVVGRIRSIAMSLTPVTAGVALIITQQASMTVDAFQIASGTLTGSTAVSLLNLSQTWNTTGAPKGVLVNITNTASGFGATLLEIQRNSASVFKIHANATDTVLVDIAPAAGENGIFITHAAAATQVALLINQNAGATAGALQINQATAPSGITILQQAAMLGDGISISGGSITTNPNGAALIRLSQTWNNVLAAPVGILVSITNTASSAASRLLDLQVAGSKFAVDVAGKVYIAGTQVLTTRQTGWGAWTGTATRTTKATGTATLVNVAEAMKALLDDLITHGIIGP